MATYQVPQLSEELLHRIDAAGYLIMRKSKDVVKLYPKDDCGIQYKRYYSFHLDMIGKVCDSMNINEYTSSYKRATIWVKVDELQIMLDTKKEITEWLQKD